MGGWQKATLTIHYGCPEDWQGKSDETQEAHQWRGEKGISMLNTFIRDLDDGISWAPMKFVDETNWVGDEHSERESQPAGRLERLE